jgi:hypothetical protein
VVEKLLDEKSVNHNPIQAFPLGKIQQSQEVGINGMDPSRADQAEQVQRSARLYLAAGGHECGVREKRSVGDGRRDAY